MWAFITSKITFSGVLYTGLALVLMWFLYSYSALSNELSNAKWELATTQSKLDSAEYNIKQMKLYEQQRKDWNAELDSMSAKFKKELESYTQTLEGIKNDRLKASTNNKLSEPVTRVLKQFNNQ